jgi:hypothetical protein|tara:strand:- start:596 stop:913 length:318 start_codon:yes stop_codon:yes gene_type:complete
MSGIATAIIIAAGATVYSGEKQAKEQRKGLRRQKQAQRQAQSQAVGQEKLAAMDMAKANRKKPDISTLLGQERLRASQGPGSTMLTGGKSGSMLLGGKSTLMGGI